MPRVAAEWAQTEVAPHIDEWETQGPFPRELYAKAAQVGLLGAGYPDELIQSAWSAA